MPNEIREFNSFMDFALGFNSVRGDIRGQAVTRTPAAPAPGDGQIVTFHARSVSSIADIQKALAVSVDASAAFLGGGGSASFDFSESSNFHSFSAFLLVTSFVTNASTHMLNEKLLDGAPTTLLSSGQTDRFTEEFGDLYIKGIETGGKFFAIIEVHTTDSTDQTSVAANLSVNAFIGGVESLNSHFKSTQMQTISTHELEINSLQIGGLGAGAKQFLTADEMLNAASNFAATVADHPVHFRVELQDYKSLDFPPPPNAADIQHAKDVIADCAARRATWLQFRNDIAFVFANPEQFEAPQTDLGALDNEGASALNQITAAASSCLNNLKDCNFVQIQAEPDRSKLPKRKAGVILTSLAGTWQQSRTRLVDPAGNVAETVDPPPVIVKFTPRGGTQFIVELISGDDPVGWPRNFNAGGAVDVSDHQVVFQFFLPPPTGLGPPPGVEHVFEVNNQFTSGAGTLKQIFTVNPGVSQTSWTRVP